MEWMQVAGRWSEFVGSARAHWSRLTDADWEAVSGDKDRLIGLVQTRYAVTTGEAATQVEGWSLGLLDIRTPLDRAPDSVPKVTR